MYILKKKYFICIIVDIMITYASKRVNNDLHQGLIQVGIFSWYIAHVISKIFDLSWYISINFNLFFEHF